MSKLKVFSLGAASMYFMDPDAGNRRRARFKEAMQHQSRRLTDFLDVAMRDLKNRSTGMFAEARYRVRGREVSDDVLVRRVASKMGRYVSHPGAVEITVEDGVVTLSGPVLKHEVNHLITALMTVPGVREVENNLDIYNEAGNIPDLQGGRYRRGRVSEWQQENWSPGVRLLTAMLGLSMYFRGKKRVPLFAGGLTGLAGLLLATRAISNKPLRRMAGAAGRRGIDFQKTVHIKASIDRVFDFFSNPTNFPQFMRNIYDVKDLGDGRSHWIARGPAGVEVNWTATITRFEPNRLIAWKSEEDSEIAHAGMIHFDEETNGTRVDIQMSYNPPAGYVGHAVASLFHSDPKTEMDEDMARAKTFLEIGKPARDAAGRRMGMRMHESGQMAQGEGGTMMEGRMAEGSMEAGPEDVDTFRESGEGAYEEIDIMMDQRGGGMTSGTGVEQTGEPGEQPEGEPKVGQPETPERPTLDPESVDQRGKPRRKVG